MLKRTVSAITSFQALSVGVWTKLPATSVLTSRLVIDLWRSHSSTTRLLGDESVLCGTFKAGTGSGAPYKSCSGANLPPKIGVYQNLTAEGTIAQILTRKV